MHIFFKRCVNPLQKKYMLILISNLHFAYHMIIIYFRVVGGVAESLVLKVEKVISIILSTAESCPYFRTKPILP